jgi:glutathione-regulated potassium-efflux system ancillary protein KefC
MDPIYIDAIWLGVAFFSGVIMKQLGLPTLVGFLLAGFFLNYADIIEGNLKDVLDTIANLGITLLLFTIGLKIKFKSLLKKEVLVTASSHMIITLLAFSGLIFLMSYTGMSFFSDMTFESSLVVGFALSFSSTVFLVKIFEERGELNSTHGKIAIGILIIQDIIAVIFISATNDVLPSIWVFLLPVYLYVIRFILNPLLTKAGHGELLTVFGFFAPFILGSLAFYAVNVKPDLGALILGMLLVNHPKNDELYERMMNYKDFFLIAFFISIGLTGKPSVSMVLIALVLVFFAFLKGYLFFKILARFNLRARTNFLASLSLANYSEFGLIVAAVGLNKGFISEDWLLIIALLMSLSFIISSPLNAKSYELFDRFKKCIVLLNRTSKEIDCQPIIMKNIEYLVIGIGSIGESALKEFEEKYPNNVLGVDYSNDTVERLSQEGFNIVWGDTTDREFWEDRDFSKIKMIMLSMSDFSSNYNTLKVMNKINNRPFKVAVICHYEDEKNRYLDLSVDYVYYYKSSLGGDLAQHAIKKLQGV